MIFIVMLVRFSFIFIAFIQTNVETVEKRERRERDAFGWKSDWNIFSLTVRAMRVWKKKKEKKTAVTDMKSNEWEKK